jgi:hypothetical protein
MRLANGVVALNFGGVRLRNCKTSKHNGDNEGNAHPSQQSALTPRRAASTGQYV